MLSPFTSQERAYVQGDTSPQFPIGGFHLKSTNPTDSSCQLDILSWHHKDNQLKGQSATLHAVAFQHHAPWRKAVFRSVASLTGMLSNLTGMLCDEAGKERKGNPFVPTFFLFLKQASTTQQEEQHANEAAEKADR